MLQAKHLHQDPGGSSHISKYCDKNPEYESCIEIPVVEQKVVVEFKDVDGTLIQKQEIKKGDSITKLPECTEEGYYYYFDNHYHYHFV